MKAKVTKSFAGVDDGTVLPRQINVGEVISGELAAVAVREKWAEEVKEVAVPAASSAPAAPAAPAARAPRKHK